MKTKNAVDEQENGFDKIFFNLADHRGVGFLLLRQDNLIVITYDNRTTRAGLEDHPTP